MVAPPLGDERWCVVLAFLQERGSVNRSEVYAHLGNPSNSLISLLDTMISQGFIREDVRPRYNSHILTITDRGKRLLSKLEMVRLAYEDDSEVGDFDRESSEKTGTILDSKTNPRAGA